MANNNIVIGRMTGLVSGHTLDGKLQMLVSYSLTRATFNPGFVMGEPDAQFLAEFDATQTDTELLTDIRTQMAAWCTARYGEAFDVTEMRGCYL